MLNHVALQINHEDDIQAFYEEIMGFKRIKSFELNSEMSASIFGLNKKVKVVLIERDSLVMELFVTGVILPFEGYQHVCLNVENRRLILDSCRKENYEVTEIPREKHNLCFVRDKSGNLFELKEW